jgi:hypothetical protein
MTAALLTSQSGFERRARLLPWGIEVQVWRLVETVIFPPAAGSLSLASLLADSSPCGEPSAEESDDEKTLENVLDDGQTHGK